MKNIYIIKETCPMFSLNYKEIKPYVFISKDEADECILDYDYISADRVLCTEYELINLEVDEKDELKEINVEGELIKVRNVINEDYEEEFRYDIHRYEWLESAGRINNISIKDYEDSEECEFDNWLEKEYLYSDLY